MKKPINKDDLLANYVIDPGLFTQYEVNRGLRKANGTGVLCGLNRIGDVHGYELIDGVKTAVPGVLFYRGFDMSEIISTAMRENRFAFEEVIYLLMLGNLPTKTQLDMLKTDLNARMQPPKSFLENIRQSPTTNVMNKLARSVLELYTFDTNPDAQDLETVFNQCLDLIARFPIILANIYNTGARQPKPEYSIAENFLYMIRPTGKFTQTEAQILDLALVLHAEHGGGNNSTFAVHVISSTGTDTYSAIAAAIGSLKGKKHGGANSEVMKMMAEIKTNVADWTDESQVAEYLAKIIKKQAGDGSGLIYGLGHAIYTISDPRTEALRQQAKLLAAEKNRENEMNLYLLVADIAPKVFAQVKGINKNICINCDFFASFIYDCLGLPEELCTPIFAMSRIVGWCAHRIDELINGGRIIRPAYKDVSERKTYIKLKDRQGDA
jgi:citrate synthase